MAVPLEKQPVHTTKEKISRWIRIRQRKTADYLNSKTVTWNRKNKILLLCCICLFFFVSIWLILLYPSKPVQVQHLGKPAVLHFLPPPKKPPGALPLIPDNNKH